jgi:hypothetical protein
MRRNNQSCQRPLRHMRRVRRSTRKTLSRYVFLVPPLSRAYVDLWDDIAAPLGREAIN